MSKRKFVIGDEWLFYKIYTGPKTSDKIISEILYPTIQKLLINKFYCL